jgi:hypothetical protein
MLGLGANISGGSPVGIVGAAAPAPLSDYFYESDMVSDEFNVFGTIVLNRISEYVGKENVISIASSTSNPAYLYTYISSCPTIVGNSYCRFEITYFIPTGSEVFNINASKNGGTYTTLLNSLTIGSWVTQTSSDILFDRGNVSSLLFRFAVSGDPIIYISSIKVIDVTDQYPLVGSSPPPGGYYDGALDQSSFSYVGAAAAYSLRLVYSYYDGPAIRVRRASDNAEQDIGFSNGVLDTSALSTFCSGTNGFVKTWYDQSLNSNDATQTTTADQPKIYDSVTGVLLKNANPDIYFNGTAHLSNSMSIVNQPITILCVTSIEAYSAGVNYIFDSDPSNTNKVFIGANTSRDWRFFAGATINTTTDAELSQTLLTGLFDASNSELHVNGVSAGTGNAGSNGMSDLYVGTKNDGLFGIKGGCQELILYPSDQSANRAAIEANINDFYQMYWDGSQLSLLDSYPSAAVAYSLRALNSAYIGPLIRVRRASDNAEQDVRATYSGLLDTSALATFCAGTNGFVKTWYDQSGGGNNAVQAATASQPKIYDSVTGVLLDNLKPTFTTGTGQGLTFTPISLTNFSIFGVMYHPGNASLVYGNSDATRLIFQNLDTALNYSTTTNGTYTGITKNAQVLLSAHRDNGVSESVYQDGSALPQITQGGAGAIELNSIMPVRPGDPNRKYQELIIYASDQSANRAAIEANINAFYSIY